MTYAHQVIGVAPRVDDPAAAKGPDNFFAYSVGLDDRGWPELLIVGLDAHQACSLINELSERDEAPLPGPVDMGGQFPLWAVDATAARTRDQYVRMADAPHGVIQLVLCDQQGRYPWDEGCVQPYAAVPVLGEVVTS